MPRVLTEQEFMAIKDGPPAGSRTYMEVRPGIVWYDKYVSGEVALSMPGNGQTTDYNKRFRVWEGIPDLHQMLATPWPTPFPDT